MKAATFLLALASFTLAPLGAQESAGTNFTPPRCELLPLPDRQVAFLHEGVEKTRWHFGEGSSVPFFYPFLGPSGVSLTRMGHPGAPDHDHHRSIWFAHAKVEGVNFWADQGGPRIRQKTWLAYEDGAEEARLAVRLAWLDTAGAELLEQELVAASLPGEGGEQFLELQITFRPGSGRQSVVLEKTNFGPLAVRVAKSISAIFGGGQLTNSEGQVGEPALFEKRAAWMDYSGPVVPGTGPERRPVREGITYFDHPANPRYPSYWHVRSDGWMGAAFCHAEDYAITAESPLVLRYLLHAHAGDLNPERAAATAAAFGQRPGFVVEKSRQSGRQFEVRRQAVAP